VVLCLRERFQAGRITGLADERTISQLARFVTGPNSRGQIVIESKEELLRRGVKSPDRADSVMLAFAKRHDPGAAFIESAFRYLERKSNPRGPDQTAALVRNGNPVIEKYNRVAERVGFEPSLPFISTLSRKVTRFSFPQMPRAADTPRPACHFLKAAGSESRPLLSS
jgi:hypothetical protein